MDVLAGRPYWSLSFAEDGTLTAPPPDTFLREVAPSGVRDLFVLSHGWNTSRDDADDLYRDLLPRVVQPAERALPLGPIGLVGIHWPALWFPDREGSAGPGGGDAQAIAGPAPPVASGDAQLSGREIAEALRDAFDDDDRRGMVQQLGKLIDDGTTAAMASSEPDAAQRARLAEFHDLLRRLVPDSDEVASEDRGERRLLFSADPERDYQAIAAEFGSIPAGGAGQGAGDVFRTVWNGAKEAMRVASYYVMKARAGDIGEKGLGPLLARLHSPDAVPGARVHLVGHSFGARLVAFALKGLPSPDESPVASLVLVQAAFSHYSFGAAQDNPFETEGALRMATDRVHGPLVATYSRHDRAVGTWYPKASALARQDNQANPAVSRWGALGGDGFQAVTPLTGGKLRAAGEDYDFAPAHFYGVDAANVIANVRQSMFAGAHSDIRHPEIAWLIAAAAASAASSPS